MKTKTIFFFFVLIILPLRVVAMVEEGEEKSSDAAAQNAASARVRESTDPEAAAGDVPRAPAELAVRETAQHENQGAPNNFEIYSDYGEVMSDENNEQALKLQNFRDALAANRANSYFIITPDLSKGLFIHALKETIPMTDEVRERNRDAMNALIAALFQEHSDIDFDDLLGIDTRSSSSSSRSYPLLTSALLQQIFDRIDARLVASIQMIMLQAKLPTIDGNKNGIDKFWMDLQQIKHHRSEATRILPLKQALLQEKQQVLEYVQKTNSSEALKQTLLGLFSKYSEKASTLAHYQPIPYLGTIAHVASKGTDLLNKLWAAKNLMEAQFAVQHASKDLAQTQHLFRQDAVDVGTLELACKKAEQEMRFSEAQKRRAFIQQLKPPLSFHENSWNKWAQDFVNVLGGEPALVASLIEAGRRDPIAVARKIEIAWKQKIVVAEQKIMEQRRFIQERINLFQTNEKEQEGARSSEAAELEPSRSEVKKALDKAEADLATAQRELEEPLNLKQQIETLIPILIELEEPRNLAISENAVILKARWEEFWHALKRLEELSNEKAIATRQGALQKAREVQGEAVVAFLALQKKYTITKDILQRNLERALDQLKMDKIAWREDDDFKHWSNFHLPEEPSIVESISTLNISRAISPPEMPDEIVEEMGRAMRRQEEGSFSAVTAEKSSDHQENMPPTVEMLFASMSVPEEHESRWAAREKLDQWNACDDDFVREGRKRSNSIWSDVGNWVSRKISFADIPVDSELIRRASIESATPLLRRHSQSSAVSSFSAQEGRSRSGSVTASVSSVASNSEQKKITKQLIKAEEGWAKQAREADDKRVAAGGIPYPENNQDRPRDKMRLDYWRQADQVALAFRRKCDRAQQENALAARINEEKWNADVERRRICARLDELEEKLQEAEEKVTIRDQQRVPHDEETNVAYLAAEQCAATLRAEAEKEKGEWLKYVKKEDDFQEAVDKETAQNIFRSKDQAANQSWERIKLLTPEEREAELIESLFFSDAADAEEELSSHHIEQVLLYRLQANKEAAQEKREEAVRRYEQGDCDPWERLNEEEREIYNEPIRTKNQASRNAFQEELEAARLAAKKAREATEGVFIWSSKKEAVADAEKAESYWNQLKFIEAERKKAISWITTTPEENKEKVKAFRTKAAVAIQASEVAKEKEKKSEEPLFNTWESNAWKTAHNYWTKSAKSEEEGEEELSVLWQRAAQKAEKALQKYQQSEQVIIRHRNNRDFQAAYSILEAAKVMAERIPWKVNEATARRVGNIEEANLWHIAFQEVEKAVSILEQAAGEFAKSQWGRGGAKGWPLELAHYRILNAAKVMAECIPWKVNETAARRTGNIEKANLWHIASQEAEKAAWIFKQAAERYIVAANYNMDYNSTNLDDTASAMFESAKELARQAKSN